MVYDKLRTLLIMITKKRSLTPVQLLFVFFVSIISFKSLNTQAKIFRNAYIAFELPDGWNCSLEATEWVCRSQDAVSSKEAIIIFTAKEIGPTDNFAIYEQTMNTERTLTSKAGSPVQSQVVQKAKQVKINDAAWVDGMQKGSEIPNYYTRYLATIKERIAILATFSAHRDFYAKYSNAFFKAITSLRVIASRGLLTNPTVSGSGGSQGVFSGNNNFSGDGLGGDIPRFEKKKGGGLTKIILALLAVIGSIGGYIYMKRKK